MFFGVSNRVKHQQNIYVNEAVVDHRTRAADMLVLKRSLERLAG